MKTDVKLKLKNLQKWNFTAFFIHLGAFLFTLFYLKSTTSRAVIYRNAFDNAGQSISRVDFPIKLEVTGTSNLKYLTAAFFGVTAFAHLLYGTDILGSGLYTKSILGRGWNPYRWFEYSISAGIMIYIISVVSGTKEQVSAVSAALITPGLMLQGYSVEGLLHQNELHDWSIGKVKNLPKVEAAVLWSNFIPAWLLFFVHWYIILSNYTKIIREAKAAGKPIDTSVTLMVYSQIFFFAMFGVIQTFQVYRWTTAKHGRLEWSYIEYEKVYLILSMVTKLALAGAIVYALRP
jgi:hypothetical protein